MLKSCGWKLLTKESSSKSASTGTATVHSAYLTLEGRLEAESELLLRAAMKGLLFIVGGVQGRLDDFPCGRGLEIFIVAAATERQNCVQLRKEVVTARK